MTPKWVPWNYVQVSTWKADLHRHDPLIEANFQEANAWVLAIAGRSCEGHECRVMDLTLKLAAAAGLIQTDHDVRQLVWAGLLHDIGKAVISRDILEKPGSLSVAELDVIRQHPALGHRLARTAPGVDNDILGAILHHHERWDGDGYPMGLIGESTPLLARMIKVADVYDALVSDRPYRAAWTADEATTYLLHYSGMIFDPRLVQIFVYRVLPTYQHPGFPLD